MKILLKDGVKYLPHKYKDEAELEQMVSEHSEVLFGEHAVFFPKQKLKTRSGLGTIPDGFLLLMGDKKWYIVEVELSSHPVYEHIVVQISKFNSTIKNPSNRTKLTRVFYEEIKGDVQLKHRFESSGIRELYKFLSEIVDRDPEIIVVIDEKTEELKEACGNLPFPTTVLEFKTYFRETVGVSVHAHLLDCLKDHQEAIIRDGPKLTRRKPGKITSQKEYRIPILESLIEIGGSGKMSEILEKVKRKMKNKLTATDLEKLPSGTSIRWKNAAQWERQKMKEEGLLKGDSPPGVWEIAKKGENYYHSQT